MAEVFLAVLEGPGRFRKPVVIKRILPKLATRPAIRQMFLDEACSIASLQHPNVVQIFELGVDGHDLFMVMEYLAGEHVNQVMRSLDHKRIGFAMAAAIASEAARGLHAAHELRDEEDVQRGIVHRDVSPENLFITYDGAVKVIDFGIAQSLASNDLDVTILKGKPAYMAPEQTVAGDVDRRADVFSLGVVLYEMSTARRLFRRSNEHEVLDAVRFAQIPKPSELVSGYPLELERICLHALDRDVKRRYQTAEEMAADLAQACERLAPGSGFQDERARLMNLLFSDRREAKRNLLRRVERGSILSSVGVVSDIAQPAVVAKSSPRRTGWIAAVLILAGLGAGVGFWVADTRGGAVDQEKSSNQREVGARRTNTAATKSPADVADATVKIRLVTVPSNVILRVGEATYVSPVELQLDRSNEPITVEATHVDHLPASQAVTPDRDQVVHITMVATSSRKKSRHRESPRVNNRGSKTAKEPSEKTGVNKPKSFYRFD